MRQGYLYILILIFLSCQTKNRVSSGEIKNTIHFSDEIRDRIIFKPQIFEATVWRNWFPIDKNLVLILEKDEDTGTIRGAPKEIIDHMVFESTVRSHRSLRYMIGESTCNQCKQIQQVFIFIKNQKTDQQVFFDDLTLSLKELFNNSRIDWLILPPLGTNERDKNLHIQNIKTYDYLVHFVQKFLEEFKESKIALADWVEIVPIVEQLMNFIYQPYYIGREEGLAEVSCWTSSQDALKNYQFLDFKTRWSSDYQTDFRNGSLSEENARDTIVDLNEGVFQFMTHPNNKPDGYGKYVFKENGCIYWKSITPFFNHTLLSKGRRILTGGWMLFDKGKLLCFDRGSGHYRTTKESFNYIIDYFKSKKLKNLFSIARDNFETQECCKVAKSYGLKIEYCSANNK